MNNVLILCPLVQVPLTVNIGFNEWWMNMMMMMMNGGGVGLGGGIFNAYSYLGWLSGVLPIVVL